MSENQKRNRARLVATVIGVPACALSSMNMQAQERKTASARLQIAVMVVPTISAPQIADHRALQPTPTSIAYNVQSDSKARPNYSIRNLVITERPGQQTAILKTTTLVPE